MLEEGPLRKFLRARGSRGSPEGPTIARSEMGRLITDEEMAWAEYSNFANVEAIRQNEWARSTVLGMADDEKRHAKQLKDILAMLEREGKLV